MMTMLGFAMVQYFAICRPLQHLYILRRRKIVLFLALTWAVSLVGGFAPLTALALIVRTEDCAVWLLSLISAVVRHGVNADAAFLAVIHILIVFLPPSPSLSDSNVFTSPVSLVVSSSNSHLAFCVVQNFLIPTCPPLLPLFRYSSFLWHLY